MITMALLKRYQSLLSVDEKVGISACAPKSGIAWLLPFVGRTTVLQCFCFGVVELLITRLSR
jgi:hypothetical protein